MALRRGFKWDAANSRLDIYVDGTVAARLNDTGSYLTIPDGGLTVTAGDLTVTAGTVAVVAANIKLGAPANFATTQPTSAVIFKAGTEFAGAIATGGGIMSSATVMRKVIADGTVSNVG